MTNNVTHKKEKKFLLALAEYGNVSKAASEAEVSRMHLYRKRKQSKVFAAAWDEAEALGVSALEDEARRRGYEGWEEPVWHKGGMCGTVRKFSDTLLIVLLKAHAPEKYAERQKLEHSGTIDLAAAINEARARAK